MLKKTMTRKYKKGGQSTVEYIILVATILAALIIFLRPGGVFQKAYNETLNTGTQGMTDMAGRLETSRPPAP